MKNSNKFLFSTVILLIVFIILTALFFSIPFLGGLFTTLSIITGVVLGLVILVFFITAKTQEMYDQFIKTDEFKKKYILREDHEKAIDAIGELARDDEFDNIG